MSRYSWPGNVRELQNVVERAAILAQGPVAIELDRVLLDGVPPAEVAIRDEAAAPVLKPHSLEELQRLHILDVLKSTGEVIEGTRVRRPPGRSPKHAPQSDEKAGHSNERLTAVVRSAEAVLRYQHRPVPLPRNDPRNIAVRSG